MKKFNCKLIGRINWVLAGLISLLGFSSSCSSNPFDDGGVVEYGTPRADFIVSGKVTNTNGQGLSGIRVVVPKVDHHQRATSSFIPDQGVITQEVRDTFYTQENGDFNYYYTGFPTNDSINIHMKFEDTAETVRFETDFAKVAFFQSDLNGGDGKWFYGRAEKKIDVKLRNAESE
jgi:putative lipoprotein (rSAM/lipoprotein system)